MGVMSATSRVGRGRGDDAREHVTAEFVGAEDVGRSGALQDRGEVLLEGSVAEPQGSR